MAENTRAIGNDGELLARRYLENAGYTIVETNWRYKRLEIDIIVTIPDLIIFVEVKLRATDEFGSPEVAVTPKKQAFLIAAANEYLLSRGIDLEARFDVVSITGDGPAAQVRHIEGAFFPVAR